MPSLPKVQLLLLRGSDDSGTCREHFDADSIVKSMLRVRTIPLTASLPYTNPIPECSVLQSVPEEHSK